MSEERLVRVPDESRMREIAREEIASLCGLWLRRMQDEPNTGEVSSIVAEIISELAGEGLNDFGKTQTGPGAE